MNYFLFDSIRQSPSFNDSLNNLCFRLLYVIEIPLIIEYNICIMEKRRSMADTNVKNNATDFDDVFRTTSNDCPELVIPVLNEIFKTDYTGNEIIVRNENEIFLRRQDGEEEKRITDSSIVIKRNNKDRGKGFHLECQSTRDGTMAVRMYQYDSQIALKNGEMKNGTLIVRFPHSAIIYLRSNSRTPDSMTIRIETSGGSISYQIPHIKIKNYDIALLFEKHLFFLLPFRIFVHEKDLRRCENSKKELEKLKEEFKEIRTRLQECCEKGIIDEYTKCTLIDMSKKVIRGLLRNKYPITRKGVEEAMGGNILEYEAKTIRNQGRAEGEAYGKEIGKEIGLVALINTLKEVLGDFESVYHAVIKNDIYQDVTREQIRKYYG